MTKYKISFIIDCLHDVIPNKEDSLEVDGVIFHYRESERVASSSLETNDESQAKLQALQKTDKSLSKICFAYNTEALIKKDGLYLVDLTNTPNSERIESNFTVRVGYLSENSQSTLSKIDSITGNKKDTLDLALAYYRLGNYDNPLRIESFFSCLTVLIRDLSNLSNKAHVPTSMLREQTKLILRKRNSQFDENKFYREWEECYANERCSIAHGHGSKLIDVSKSNEYETMVSTVGFWTREVIYYFINANQVPGSQPGIN
jgi:hypothetical protein